MKGIKAPYTPRPFNASTVACMEKAYEMHARGEPLYDILASLRKQNMVDSTYTIEFLSWELWYITTKRGRRNGKLWRSRFVFNPEKCAGEAILVPAGTIACALADLERGTPCTISGHPWSTIPQCDAEAHMCAPAAYTWLTSSRCELYCDAAGWHWPFVAGQVLEVAREVKEMYPWVVLTASLVFRLACILEGEAGGMDTRAMYLVADTILSRVASDDFPSTIEENLGAYYGYKSPPSEEAMRVARMAVEHPWEPSGRVYAYSEHDRIRKGWWSGDITYEQGGAVLHFRQQWPAVAPTPVLHPTALPTPIPAFIGG